MAERVLLRGGHVLSMDAEIGDVYGGDVLIEDGRIAAVGTVARGGRRRGDRRAGCIVIPGFIDSHRHTWETVIRGIAPDVSLGGYFDLVLDQLAPAYRAEDVYAGNYLGSLEAIDAGVTTLLDWSHINNTPSTPTRRSAGCATRACGRSTATATRTPRWPTGGTRARSSRPRTSAGCATSTSRATTA